MPTYIEDQMLKADAGIASKPIGDVLKAMQRLAVILLATGVLRSELVIMRQGRDEQFRSFAARVLGKADTCFFSATCSCGLKVDYTDHVIRNTLLSRNLDDKIRQDVIGIDNILTKPINNIIALVESKEMARSAVPTPDFSTLSRFKRQHATAKAPAGGQNSSSAARPPNVSKKSRCPQCDKLFSLYKQGPRSWNVKPYSMRLDCFRSHCRRQRRNLLARMEPVTKPTVRLPPPLHTSAWSPQNNGLS